ncbi:TPR-like protein [Rhizoctonia solani]|uniref:TPR-like protein n=1 Tax=Rhizoctonia solani TaxID=456999 RepID=A0A8H7LXT6_9AGAM|nr:TPR-like protein [Rhizoctonia solani]
MSSIGVRQRELWDQINCLKQACISGQINPDSLQAEATRIIGQLEETRVSMPEDCARHLQLVYSIYSVLYPLPSDSFGAGTDYVDLCVRCEILAVAYTSMEDTQFHIRGWLSNLGQSYKNRFEILGNIDDLNLSIEYQRQSISLAPDAHVDMAAQLTGLGCKYMTRFEQLGELEDVDNAMGLVYYSRFERLGRIEDINKAIELQNQVVSAEVEGHPDAPDWFSNLGNSYLSRFGATCKQEDLNNAIYCHKKAISLTPEGEDSEGLSSRLNNLGNSCMARFEYCGQEEDMARAIEYQTRFRRSGSAEDINNAIEYHTKATELTNDEDPSTPIWLNNLSGSYSSRFDLSGNLDDLKKAINYANHALAITPEKHPLMASRLTNLGNLYMSRFDRFDEVDDIEKAIEFHSKAVLLFPTGHEDLPVGLNSLGNSYMSRFRRNNNLTDITKAIEHHRHAISMVSRSHPAISTYLDSLGLSYAYRFGYLGDQEDMNQAILYHKEAIQLTPADHPLLPEWLANLGSSLVDRFQHHHELEDLNQAIENQSRAITLTPKAILICAPDLCTLELRLDSDLTVWAASKILIQQSISKFRRFGHLKETKDIDLAIKHQTKAVTLVSEGNTTLPGRLNNLSCSHLQRFSNSEALEDLNSAIEYQRKALLLIPKDHIHTHGILSNLATTYLSRFEAAADLADIDEAIELYSHAVSTAPEDHVYRLSSMNHLGRSLRHRFTVTRNLKDIDDAIEYHSYALSKTPDDDMNAPMQLRDLGKAYSHRFRIMADATSLGNALKCFGKAAQSRATDPTQRFLAACDWIDLSSGHAGSELLKAARLLWISFQRSFGLALPSHKDTTIYTLVSQKRVAQKRHRLAEDYENTLIQVRQTPGFENFLRPKRLCELLPAAHKGPVVLINVDKSRCDALVITPSSTDVFLVPLFRISYNQIVQLRDRIERSLEDLCFRKQSNYRRPLMLSQEENPQNQDFEFVLSTIWTGITKPVLDFLGYKASQELPTSSIDSTPHITWCTTGPLSSLPLHAAGNYSETGAKVFQYVISSYTPTLGAVIPGHSPELCVASSVLGIAQENTPGQGHLPGTTNELSRISEHAKAPIIFSRLTGSCATTLATLDAMEQHDWIHLACHATQDIAEPTESGFFLHDGILALSRIAQKDSQGKGLAFLSACQTATGDRSLTDESVHLASGMLMAGYPSVIATSWSIVDCDAPLIADTIYQFLLKDGKMNHRDTAKALHVAVEKLREHIGEKMFWRWAPYIHIGI